MTRDAPLQARFVDALSESERGAGFGLVRSVYVILGAAGSVVIAATADQVGWTIAFGLLSAITGVELGVILLPRLLGFDYWDANLLRACGSFTIVVPLCETHGRRRT